MKLTVLGSCGAWPQAGDACSGYLVEHDGFRLVLDLGYATLPRLLDRLPAEAVDAVLVSHGHPDHCADLNPLLRARALGDRPAGPLPVHAPAGALDAVLALDRPGMLDDACVVRELVPGPVRVGPFTADIRFLPHWVPNAGVRLTAGGRSLAYTGDAGPDPAVVELARGTDLLLAEATYAGPVPEHSRGHLSSARTAAGQAARAGARRLLLTHLWPGTDPRLAVAAAAGAYDGPLDVARSGTVVDLDSAATDL